MVKLNPEQSNTVFCDMPKMKSKSDKIENEKYLIKLC